MLRIEKGSIGTHRELRKALEEAKIKIQCLKITKIKSKGIKLEPKDDCPIIES